MIVYTGQSLYQAADCPDFTGDIICMDEQLPLTGVKIVDLSTYAAVPAAARILADWGANVIKVESFKGDSWRRYGEIAQVPCTEDENPCWDVNNSNKRSISSYRKRDGNSASSTGRCRCLYDELQDDRSACYVSYLESIASDISTPYLGASERVR